MIVTPSESVAAADTKADPPPDDNITDRITNFVARASGIPSANARLESILRELVARVEALEAK